MLAVGKRKTATAVVTLRPGAGVISVNKKTFADYFPRAEDRHQVLYPMQVTELLGKYDITATVRGGGATGAVMSQSRCSYLAGRSLATVLTGGTLKISKAPLNGHNYIVLLVQ